MAATAYASLVSLLNTLDLIQTHPCLSTYFVNYQLQSLRKMVDFLADFVVSYSEAKYLVRRIGDAARKAEYMIETEAADRILGGSIRNRNSLTMLLHLERLIQDISFIKDEVIKFKDETGFLNFTPPPPSSSSSSSAPRATKKTTMLGFDRYVVQLLDQLIGDDCRRILPIVGMGGVGKTTLARNLHEHSVVVHHFDVRGWVNVSQEYNASDMLSQALSCLGLSSNNKSNDQLGGELHRSLFGRRYLIILDDVWSVEAWEKIQFFFPQNDNGSRVVVTTRQQEVASYFGSSSLAVEFLDYKNSWKLFCDVTFAQQDCPTELEQIAEQIIMKCKGLPLAICVIGGLLEKSLRTQEYWEKIAKDKGLVMEYSGYGSTLSSILYMSYKYLPVWLRPCFLYLGLFSEDCRINVSHLIKLWIAEGFIKPTKDQSLEQIAESYIKELIDRNLLLVGQLKINKKFHDCCLHDLVREMCIRTAKKEDFYRESHTSIETPSVTRPLILSGRREVPFKSTLLRLLINDQGSCLDSCFQEVNLRYIKSRMPIRWLDSISLCWSLQSLILGDYSSSVVVVPSVIWTMPQLRHIEIPSMYLTDPPHSDVFVLHNLQTLKTVLNRIFTEEVCARIPNIRELAIEYDFEERAGVSRGEFHLQNLGRLNKLESLKIICDDEGYVGDPFKNLKLPCSLRELLLHNCYIVWSDMAIIASLPHLQLLRLESLAVAGGKWNFVKEEFRCLKHLIVSCCRDLIIWTANAYNFPVLETLHLWNLHELYEIPWDIGEIPTLEKICVLYCKDSVIMSAIKIVEEQEDLGNQALQLEIQSSGDGKWREEIKGRFTSQNLHIL